MANKETYKTIEFLKSKFTKKVVSFPDLKYYFSHFFELHIND